jgi:hypothetical protein
MKCECRFSPVYFGTPSRLWEIGNVQEIEGVIEHHHKPELGAGPCLSEPRHATPLVSYGTGAWAQPNKPRLRLPSGCCAQSEENDGAGSTASLGFASYVWRGRFWMLPFSARG